jgi:hypothetical protein
VAIEPPLWEGGGNATLMRAAFSANINDSAESPFPLPPKAVALPRALQSASRERVRRLSSHTVPRVTFIVQAVSRHLPRVRREKIRAFSAARPPSQPTRRYFLRPSLLIPSETHLKTCGKSDREMYMEKMCKTCGKCADFLRIIP